MGLSVGSVKRGMSCGCEQEARDPWIASGKTSFIPSRQI